MYKIDRKTHKIDATGKSVGRLATQIATLLMGKHKSSYQPHIDNGDFVIVENADQARFTGKKFEQKRYYHHSGYPGGLKEEKLSELFKKNPEGIFKLAVKNMLPKNKLQTQRLKRLIVK